MSYVITGLVTMARFLIISQLELIKANEMAAEWQRYKEYLTLFLSSMRFAFMSIRYILVLL